MALYLRQCWRQQPQGAVTINWNNPVTRGLICAWNAATPTRNYATNLSINDVNSGAFSYAKSRRGIVYRSESAGATSPVILLPTANVPTGEMSVTLHYRKTDAGLRQSSGWGTADYASDRFHAHMPWDNGTLYFDYGGATGNNRIEVSGLNYGDDTWTFQSTTSGLRAWQNGKLIGQNFAGLVTRVAGANPFRLLSGSGLTDLAESSFVFIHNRGLINTEIAALHENPYQIFRLRKQISFSLPTNYSRPVQDVYNPNNNTTGNASKIVGAGVVAQFLPRRCRQQPQGAAQVDWSNPLTRGLSFAVSPGTGGIASPDAVSGVLPESLGTNVSITGTTAGRALTFSNGGNLDFPTRLKPLEGASKLTVDCLIYLPNNPGTDVHIFGQWTTNVSWLFLRRNNRFAFAWGQMPASGAAGGAYESNIAQGGISNNKWTHVAFVWDAATNRYDFYFDGASPGASNLWFGSLPLAIQATTDPVRLGHNAAFTGSIATIRTWKRALSATEIAALSENPWQLFKPRKQIIYVPQTGWTRIP